MKVLFFTGTGVPHEHDYGTDNLCQGLYNLLGAPNVYDWPQKHNLHLGAGEVRDECNLDCDAWLPRKEFDMHEVAGEVDLVIVSHLAAGLRLRADMFKCPVAFIDYSDNPRPIYSMPGAKMFKREMLLTGIDYPKDWEPLPLSYPGTVIRSLVGPWVTAVRRSAVYYRATSHGNTGPGLPRMEIVAALRMLCDSRQLDVGLMPSQQNRPSPEEYHDAMRRCSVGISWNGTEKTACPNWDSNRFWENFAFGLCQVAERPRIRIPFEPKDREHVFYADSPIEVAEIVRDLLLDHEKALEVAREGKRHFYAHHTSEMRARHLIELTLGYRADAGASFQPEMEEREQDGT